MEDILKRCIENCDTVDSCIANCDKRQIYEMSLVPPNEQILLKYLEERTSSEVTITRLLHFFLGMTFLPPPYIAQVSEGYIQFLRKSVSRLKFNVLLKLEEAIVKYRKSTNPIFASLFLPNDAILRTIREEIMVRTGGKKQGRNHVTKLGNWVRSQFANNVYDKTCILNSAKIYYAAFAYVFKRFNLINRSKHIEWLVIDNEKEARRVENKEDTNLHLCAIIVVYKSRRGETAHAVSYVKIFDTWYNADDTEGVLRARTNGQPTWNTTIYEHYTEEMIYFYVDRSKVPDTQFLTPYHDNILPNKGQWHGIPTFSQSGRGSCVVDAIFSCIFYANGFRDIMTDIFYITDANGHSILNTFERQSGESRVETEEKILFGESSIGGSEEKLVSYIENFIRKNLLLPFPQHPRDPSLPAYVVKTGFGEKEEETRTRKKIWESKVAAKKLIIYESAFPGQGSLISEGLFKRVLRTLSASCVVFLSNMKYIYAPQKGVVSTVPFDESLGIQNDPDTIKAKERVKHRLNVQKRIKKLKFEEKKSSDKIPLGTLLNRKGHFTRKNTRMSRARGIKSHIPGTAGISRFLKTHSKKKSLTARNISKLIKTAFLGRNHLNKKTRVKKSHRRTSQGSHKISASNIAIPVSRPANSVNLSTLFPIFRNAPASRAIGGSERASKKSLDPHAGKKE